MSNRRITQSEALKALTKLGCATRQEFATALNTTSKHVNMILYRLKQKKLVKFFMEDGEAYWRAIGSEHNYFDEITLEKVTDYLNEVNHRYLNVLPLKVGGKQDKGSGWLSSWKGLITVLNEMGENGYL